MRSTLLAAGLVLGVQVAGLHAQAPTVTVGGVGYAQYSYALKVDSTLTPVSHANNFDVTRAYVNAVGKFADGIMTRITLDVDGRKAAPNQLSIRLKYAYVAWTPEKSALTYKIGEMHTPWLDWEEALWDYRMQGSMAMERTGYLSSADFGVGVDGNWGYDKVNLQAGIYNGENYNNAPGDQRKDVSARLSVRLRSTDKAGRDGGLRLTAYAQYGLPTGGGDRQRYIGMLSYKTTQFTLGAEYGITKDSSTAAASTSSLSGQVISAFGVAHIPHTKASVVARVDVIDPDKDVTSPTPDIAANKQTRTIIGVSYDLSPHLRVMADADLNSAQNGSPNNAFDSRRQTLNFHTQFTY